MTWGNMFVWSVSVKVKSRKYDFLFIWTHSNLLQQFNFDFQNKYICVTYSIVAIYELNVHFYLVKFAHHWPGHKTNRLRILDVYFIRRGKP